MSLSPRDIDIFCAHHKKRGVILAHVIFVVLVAVALHDIFLVYIVAYILANRGIDENTCSLLVVFCGVKMFVPRIRDLKWVISLVLCAYLLTDISHYLFKETPYNESYANHPAFIRKKVSHHVHLPYLIMISAFRYTRARLYNTLAQS